MTPPARRELGRNVELVRSVCVAPEPIGRHSTVCEAFLPAIGRTIAGGHQVKITRINHIGVLATDMENVLRLYREVLGLKLRHEKIYPA